MKNATVENKKIVKAAQPRRVAGVPVRSGVKAGVQFGDKEFLGPGGPAPEKPGKTGFKPGGLF